MSPSLEILDWDRLEFLRKKFEQVRLLVREDLDRFLHFLQNSAEQAP